MIQKIALQAVISPNEVQIIIRNAISPGKQVLTSTSVKTTVEIEGIQYTNSSALVARGLFVFLIQSGVKTQTNFGKNLTENDFQMHNQATNYQGKLQISESTFGNVSSGFISWDNFVTVQNGATFTTESLIVSNATSIGSNNSEILVKISFDTYNIWFSPQSQVSNFVWDPTAGMSAGSSASTSADTGSIHTSRTKMTAFHMVTFACFILLVLLLM